MPLPTEKTRPTLDPTSAKVLLAGPPKIGKTTLASRIDPDSTLILATEPGYGAIEAFVVPINSWAEFRQVGGELAAGKHTFTTVVVDTVDELYKLCQAQVMVDVGIVHPSDMEYGKGYGLVGDEFRLRVGKLCSLGLGVWFISHTEEREIKQKVGTITRHVPSLTGKTGKWLAGFVDFIFMATSEQGQEGGDTRLLRTQATENFEAGGRVTLPDPLPLDAAAVREAMLAAAPKPEAPQPQQSEPEAGAQTEPQQQLAAA